MTKLDRILSLAILLACALALYGVWLDRTTCTAGSILWTDGSKR